MASAFKCDICGKLWEGKPVSMRACNDYFLCKTTTEKVDICLVCHESLQSWARHHGDFDCDDVLLDLNERNRSLENENRTLDNEICGYLNTIKERDQQIEKLERQLREAEATMRMLPIDEPCEASGADPRETIDCIKMGR